ncbi:transglutaminase domain-containing protein [Winogradskyella undariae]|uniref:transglutaminase domain-containing protein n=1 Tax=Winogradskyella undariae TaxID=1285465 RepID=UPI0015CCFA1F|nr:transglutaminase domain-containing protein [Winogradskyella undariae]
MKIKKKVIWFFKRHPFLYYVRFKLLSKNSSVKALEDKNYNVSNKIEDIPLIFQEMNTKIFKKGTPKGTLESCKLISIWLGLHLKKGPGLSESSEGALKIMLEGKGGICSDMAQVFNNFCLLNNIKVREWGVIRNSFDKTYGGHSFNEIYSTEYNKWVLFDAFWGVYFIDNKGIPFSVTDLYKAVRNKEVVHRDNFFHISYLPPNDYEKNYFHLDNIPFLVCDYSNRIYDRALNYFKPYIPVFIIHFGIYVIGKSYHYEFPIDNYRTILKKQKLVV